VDDAVGEQAAPAGQHAPAGGVEGVEGEPGGEAKEGDRHRGHPLPNCARTGALDRTENNDDPRDAAELCGRSCGRIVV
jgi:hypothetical protein